MHPVVACEQLDGITAFSLPGPIGSLERKFQ